MLRLRTLCATLVCSLWCSTTQGQDGRLVLKAPDGSFVSCEGQDCAALPGQRGVWWPVDKAQQLTIDHKDAETLRSTVSLLDERLELRAERIATLEQQQKLALEQRDSMSEIADDSSAEAAKCEARSERAEQGRARRLWFGVGASVVAVLVSFFAGVAL